MFVKKDGIAMYLWLKLCRFKFDFDVKLVVLTQIKSPNPLPPMKVLFIATMIQKLFFLEICHLLLQGKLPIFEQLDQNKT